MNCCQWVWLLVFPLFISGQKHAFYLSTLEIAPIGEEVSAYSLRIKTFTDDLENGVQNHSGNPIRIAPQMPEKDRERVKSYLTSRVSIRINGNQTELRLADIAYFPEATSATLRFNSPSPIKELEITCTLLTELFETQVNVVGVQVGEEKRWLKLDRDMTSQTVSF